METRLGVDWIFNACAHSLCVNGHFNIILLMMLTIGSYRSSRGRFPMKGFDDESVCIRIGDYIVYISFDAYNV